MMMNKQKEKAGFKESSDRRIQPFATVPYAFNSTLSATLPKVGYVTHILAYVNLTVTSSGTITPGRDGVYSFIPNVRNEINSGSGLLVSARSFALNAFAPLWGEIGVSNGFGSGSTSNPFWVQQGTTNGSAVSFLISIPVSANVRTAYEVGCQNVQNQNLQMTVSLQTATSATDYGTNCTGASGTVQFFYVYSEAVNPLEVELPEPLVFTFQETFFPISSNGVNTYTLPKRGITSGITLDVIYNSVRTPTALQNLELVLNKTDKLHSAPNWLLDYWTKSMLGYQPIAGTFVMPFGGWGASPGDLSWNDFVAVNNYSTTDLSFTTSGTVGGLTGIFVGVPTIQPLVTDNFGG